jgi:hypothetical protein
LSPTTIDVPIEGGTFGIKVSGKPDCMWAIEKAPSWVLLRAKSGTGPGAIGFVVERNPDVKRSGPIVVNRESVTVLQAGR